MRPRELDDREWAPALRVGWSQAWEAYESADIAGTIEFALSVEIAGVSIRAATAKLDTPAPDGTVRSWMPYLLEDFEFAESYNPGDGGAGTRSLSLTLPSKMSNADDTPVVVDVFGWIAGGLLAAGSAELSVLFPGCPLVERRVLLDGDVSGGVTFGGPGEPIEFGAEDPYQTASQFVSSGIIDDETWPSAADASKGQRYPLVWNTWSRVDCYEVNGQRYLACVDGRGIDATSFTVFVDGVVKTAADFYYGHTISLATDVRGVPYWSIQFTGALTLADEAVQVKVIADGGKYLHELIEYLLTAYSGLGRRRIHFGLIGDIETLIGSVAVRMMVNGSGESSTATSFELCESRIANSFPMLTFAFVDGRYGPIVTDGRAPSTYDLTEGVTLLRRASSITESPKGELANRFVVRAGYSAATSTYTLVATRDETTSILCSRSAAVVGVKDGEVVEADLIMTQADAEMVVDWLAFHRSMPYYDVQFDVPSLLGVKLRLGRNVTLYVPSLGWSAGVKATIVGRSLRRGYATMTFRIWWANLAGANVGGGAAGYGGGGFAQ